MDYNEFEVRLPCSGMSTGYIGLVRMLTVSLVGVVVLVQLLRSLVLLNHVCLLLGRLSKKVTRVFKTIQRCLSRHAHPTHRARGPDLESQFGELIVDGL